MYTIEFSPELVLEEAAHFDAYAAVAPFEFYFEESVAWLRYQLPRNSWRRGKENNFARLTIPSELSRFAAETVLLVYVQETRLVQLPFIYHKRGVHLKVGFKRKRRNVVVTLSGNNESPGYCPSTLEVIFAKKDPLTIDILDNVTRLQQLWTFFPGQK